MCLQASGRRIPFAFLDDVKDKFLAAYGPEAAQYAVAYEYNTEFSGILQQRMRYFVNDPNADAINRVRGGVAEVKNIMVENIEKVQCQLAKSCCMPAHTYRHPILTVHRLRPTAIQDRCVRQHRFAWDSHYHAVPDTKICEISFVVTLSFLAFQLEHTRPCSCWKKLHDQPLPKKKLY